MNKPADLLQFTTEILAACCDLRPAQDRTAPAAFWSLTIPKAQKIIQHLISFARFGGMFEINVNGLPSVAAWMDGQPSVTANGIVIRYRYRLDGSEKSEMQTQLIPWPNDVTRELFSGEWTKLGAAEIRINPASIFPELKPTADGAIVEWADPPAIRYARTGWFVRLFGRYLTASIKKIEITPTDGEIMAPGLIGWMLPRLVWGAS